MPVMVSGLRPFRNSYTHTLELSPGLPVYPSLWYYSCRVPDGIRFYVQRLRAHAIGDYCPGELNKLKVYSTVSLRSIHRTLWEGPLSDLFVEDWIRNAVMKINKSRSRHVEKYLDRAFAHGRVQSEYIPERDCQLQLTFCTGIFDFVPSRYLALKFMVEGIEFRPVQ